MAKRKKPSLVHTKASSKRASKTTKKLTRPAPGAGSPSRRCVIGAAGRSGRDTAQHLSRQSRDPETGGTPAARRSGDLPAGRVLRASAVEARDACRRSAAASAPFAQASRRYRRRTPLSRGNDRHLHL